MQLRCKEGDLAMVVYDEPSCRTNIGRVVRLKGPPARHSYYGEICWLIYPVDERPWLVVRDHGIEGIMIVDTDRVDHPDLWLMPLQP